MTTYEIKLFCTRYAKNNEKGKQALDRAKHYIETVFANYLPHSANVITSSTYPSALTEVYNESFEAPAPCHKNFTLQYSNLNEWFSDWVECVSTPVGKHANVLITGERSAGGGLTRHDSAHTEGTCSESNPDPCLPTSYAVSQGSEYIAEADSTFQRRRMSVNHVAMQTVFHELGHCLLGERNEHNDHQVGEVTKVNWDFDHHWVTPMGLNEQWTNDCGETFDRPGDNVHDRHWDLVWSDCCVNDWKCQPNDSRTC